MSSTTFSLAGLGLKLNTSSDLTPHITPLTSSPSTITHFDLSGNTIGVEAAAALAPHLSKLTSLVHANLADIFTSRLLSEIPPALSFLLTALLPLKNLHTINLSDNAFGLNTQAPLVSFLEKHTPLRHLILNNNGLGPEAGTLVANALARLAEAKKTAGAPRYLETIVCGRNRLENGSSAAWAEALALHAGDLKELRMTQNGIRVEGMSAIVRSLRNATQLQALDLQDNLFDLKGAQALVEVLTGWGELRELSVQDTLLRARGGLLLGEALAKGKNAKLEVLRLQYNEINAKGVAGLLEAAKTKLPTLRRVELNGNVFAEEDESVEALADLLSERREEAGGEAGDEGWGLDELDELDDDDEEDDDDEDKVDDEDAEDDEEESVDSKAEKELKLADQEENQKVSQKQDEDVDELADKLGKVNM